MLWYKIDIYGAYGCYGRILPITAVRAVDNLYGMHNLWSIHAPDQLKYFCSLLQDTCIRLNLLNDVRHLLAKLTHDVIIL